MQPVCGQSCFCCPQEPTTCTSWWESICQLTSVHAALALCAQALCYCRQQVHQHLL